MKLYSSPDFSIDACRIRTRTNTQRPEYYYKFYINEPTFIDESAFLTTIRDGIDKIYNTGLPDDARISYKQYYSFGSRPFTIVFRCILDELSNFYNSDEFNKLFKNPGLIWRAGSKCFIVEPRRVSADQQEFILAQLRFFLDFDISAEQHGWADPINTWRICFKLKC
jgi:hypothetical protein